MSRGIGEFAIQEYIPEWLAVIIAVLTQLGDFWFLALILGVLYWTQVEHQEAIAVVGGITLTGLGLYRGLKYLFELPRPDEPPLDPELLPWLLQPLWELTATAGGYGFPSGHATSSTIVYFGLAAVLTTISTRRKRFAVAGTVVGIVGFSRIVLGVHYLVDIVVGVALGALLLVVALKLLGPLTARQGTIIFGLSIVTGTFYVSTSEADLEAVIVLGIALGAFAGWQLVILAGELVGLDRPSDGLRPLLVRGGSAVLALTPLVVAIEAFPLAPALFETGPPYAAGGTAGLLAVVVLIVPIARHSRRVRRVGGVVRFYLNAALNWLRSVLWWN